MEDLVGKFETSGMYVTCKSGRKIGRLPELIQTTVYRVVQEALDNAAKHSGTDVVRIELNKTDDYLHLEIRDFGCGFDVPAARKKGFGLLGMTNECGYSRGMPNREQGGRWNSDFRTIADSG